MMAILGIFGKKRITESFFVNSFGNNQTRGIYTFQIDIDSGEILFRKYFNTPSDPIVLIMGDLFVLHTKIRRVQMLMAEFVLMRQLQIY